MDNKLTPTDARSSEQILFFILLFVGLLAGGFFVFRYYMTPRIRPTILPPVHIPTQTEIDAYVTSNANVHLPTVASRKPDTVLDVAAEVRKFILPGIPSLASSELSYTTTAKGYEATYTIGDDPSNRLNRNPVPVTLAQIYTNYSKNFSSKDWKVINVKQTDGIVLVELQSSRFQIQITYAQKKAGNIYVHVQAIQQSSTSIY